MTSASQEADDRPSHRGEGTADLSMETLTDYETRLLTAFRKAERKVKSKIENPLFGSAESVLDEEGESIERGLLGKRKRPVLGKLTRKRARTNDGFPFQQISVAPQTMDCFI